MLNKNTDAVGWEGNRFSPDSLQLIVKKAQLIPGAIQYKIERYNKLAEVLVDDKGMLVYSYNSSKTSESYLQLKFCITGNMYCNNLKNCSHCSAGNFKNCNDGRNSVNVINIHFSSAQLSQFIKAKPGNTVSDDVLKFRHKSSFTKILPVCNKIKNTIEDLVNHQYSGSLENIYVNAQLQLLLLFSIDCITGLEAGLPECRFLNNEADLKKVARARELLIEHIGEPITIKELSRKVAMNECYLKKGFKELYGATIFDFYQNQRMEHAKYLLYEKGFSVTDVSIMLGYSSISHFSTAFKKHTGLKPCELLFR